MKYPTPYNELNHYADISVCYTHFISLCFNNRPFNRINKILGKDILAPLKRTYDTLKKKP